MPQAEEPKAGNWFWFGKEKQRLASNYNMLHKQKH
jgi:hypothetical protein